jgi:hypothetical protein
MELEKYNSKEDSTNLLNTYNTVEPKTTDELFDSINNPEVKRKLALGPHFDALRLTPAEQKQLREDLIAAKKYELAVKDRIIKEMETEELRKIIMPTSKEDGSKNNRLEEYHEQLRIIQKKAEEKMENAIRKAKNYELQKLKETQETFIQWWQKNVLPGINPEHKSMPIWD